MLSVILPKGEEVEECKVIKNNFTTYTHWIDDTSLSVPNYYARPVDSDSKSFVCIHRRKTILVFTIRRVVFTRIKDK